jgi:hypothetical protein
VPNQFGIFMHGIAPAQLTFGDGFLCTTGGIRRGTTVTAAANSATYAYDGSTARRDLAVHVGTTRHFQFWFRDPMGAGGSGFNTSNALATTVLP